MNNRNWWNSVCRPVAAVALVGVVLVGQVMAQGPLRGPSGEIILDMGTVDGVAFSPDGEHIVVASDMGAWVFDVETGSLVRTFSGHLSEVTCMAFSPDGRRVLTGSEDDTAKLWDMRTGALIQIFEQAWISAVGRQCSGPFAPRRIIPPWRVSLFEECHKIARR